MKSSCSQRLILSFVVQIAAAAAEVSLRLHVTDDFGEPVPSATIQLFTYAFTRAGEGFGKDMFKTTTARTDSNGIAVVRGRSPISRVSFGILPSKDYYDADVQDSVFNESRLNKWQPWNPTLEVELKPVLNPVPVYLSSISTHVKAPNRRSGFDLMIEDWVSPEGKGKVADVILEMVGFWRTNREYDSTLVVSFPNPGDGIQEFDIPQPGKRSRLLSPRFAPVAGYVPELRLRKTRIDATQTWIDDTAKKRGYFLRIRSRRDEKGQLQRALYGKIEGGFSFFGAAENSYLQIPGLYLNPELNSTNMEFDLKRTLPQPATHSLPAE